MNKQKIQKPWKYVKKIKNLNKKKFQNLKVSKKNQQKKIGLKK